MLGEEELGGGGWVWSRGRDIILCGVTSLRVSK